MHKNGRRTGYFRETQRVLSGDDPGTFGRRTGYFRETQRVLSGDDPGTFGRRNESKTLAKTLNFKQLLGVQNLPTI